MPLAQFNTDGPVNIAVTAAGKRSTYSQGKDFAVRAAATNIDRVKFKNAPLVFLGYGVTAPERKWDDYQGVDMKGKIGIVLVNDPDFETGAGDFGGKAMTYYGRWTYKYEEGARHGALGILDRARDGAGLVWLGHRRELQHQRDLRHPAQGSAHRARRRRSLDPAQRRSRSAQAGGPRLRATEEAGPVEHVPRGAAEGRDALARLQA